MQFLVLSRRRVEQYSDEDFAAVLPNETDAVRTLYADGVVRQIWLRGDVAGAAFVIEAESASDAQSTIDALPMASSGLSEFTLIPLAPYRGFGPVPT
ncbi:MAG: hypothetical protein WBG53_22380 [Rhodococcus sp. (in: high G+C Gram-positive bacteria)]|uniref:hypothetical protein n=1 Tax=unclassified Rhodococcus (in: high G+C Gram-positive bacteria) TaxID=192944 RepID=UPI000A6E9311|nr:MULTISPECIES: hypothetical protein [unclassified Rhodococcus (in: high G+C Gram-positive bacteria)]RMB77623.1 hypothetical protein AYK61_15230 [Rhodococcus sp. SBT000017]